MSEYGLMTKDIEIDIRILEDLVSDIEYYREVYEADTEDPQRAAMHQENLEFAFQQYKQHKEYLLPRLEDWMKETLKVSDRPVRLDYYRILNELRKHKKKGI